MRTVSDFAPGGWCGYVPASAFAVNLDGEIFIDIDTIAVEERDHVASRQPGRPEGHPVRFRINPTWPLGHPEREIAIEVPAVDFNSIKPYRGELPDERRWRGVTLVPVSTFDT
jgi:hypothetical protein